MENRRLIIRTGRGSLSFSTTQGGEVVYEAYPVKSSISMAANLREALRTVPLLADSYGRVLVTVDCPVLMVPTALFREDEQEALYRHSFTMQEPQVVMNTVLPDLNAVVVFAVLRDLHSVLADTFGQPHYSAAVAPVWRHLHERSYTGPRQKLYGYFHDRRMEVFSFAQNRFRFCNSYAVSQANDALYYLLAAWKQLSMDPQHDELHLVGDFAQRDELMQQVQTFVKRVYYINPSGEFNRAAVTQIAGMPYDLVTLYVKGR